MNHHRLRHAWVERLRHEEPRTVAGRVEPGLPQALADGRLTAADTAVSLV